VQGMSFHGSGSVLHSVPFDNVCAFVKHAEITPDPRTIGDRQP
jgi:hypothetical protein